MFDKIKDKLQSHSSVPSTSSSSDASYPQPPQLPPLDSPTSTTLFRYRHQSGLNLGSLFVCEKWITPNVFSGAGDNGSSDLDIAQGSNPKETFNKHWDEFTPNQEDWEFITSHGFNTIRLPIAYYHLLPILPSKDTLRDTEFGKVVEEGVFDGVWERILKVIEEAGKRGVGVLIDLHAGVGGQNGDAHCGISTGKSKLFSSSKNQDLTILCLRALAANLAPIPNVVGLEILNEPANNSSLEGFYKRAIKEVGAVGGEGFPLYISDAWDTQHYTSSLSSISPSPTFPLAIDHHLYRCFTQSDSSRLGTDHASDLSPTGSFGKQIKQWSEGCSGQMIVGEFSAALSGGSIPDGADGGEGDRQKREFLRAELGLFDGVEGEGGLVGGWFFWTLKKGDGGWDNGWSAKDAMRSEVLPSFVGKKMRQGAGDGGKDEKIKGVYDSHVSYWSNNSPSTSFEHDRFQTGLSLGWDDAKRFIESQAIDSSGGVSVLGFWKWTLGRRLEEHLRERPRGKEDMVWEFEHGYKQGVQMANKALLE